MRRQSPNGTATALWIDGQIQSGVAPDKSGLPPHSKLHLVYETKEPLMGFASGTSSRNAREGTSALLVRIGFPFIVAVSFFFGMFDLQNSGVRVVSGIIFAGETSGALEVAKFVVSIVAIVLSLSAIVVSAVLTKKLKNRDVLYERRKLFITALWDKLVAVRGLDPGNVTVERVIEVLNTLELVALCWEDEVADRSLVARAFAQSYCELVDQIQAIVPGAGYDDVIKKLGTGPSLLADPYVRVVPVRKKLEKFLVKS